MIGVWLAASDLVMRVSRFPQTQMSSCVVHVKSSRPQGQVVQ